MRKSRKWALLAVVVLVIAGGVWGFAGLNGAAPPIDPSKIAVVESGTTDRQRVVRTVLGQLAAAQVALEITPPALLIVGETTRYAERYSWFAPSKIEYFADEPADEAARVTYRNTNKAGT